MSAAVYCRGLSFVYPDNRAALRNVDLEVEQGEKIGIIGPNGAGKSTFITLLNGLNLPQGELKINGLEVNSANLKRIRGWVGVAFQNPDDQLFCPTIFEDVAFGPRNQGLKKDEIDRRVKRALEEVGLAGYEQRSSLHLSFGERKLASIAAVISMHPRIIALDEPTSNLDALHRRKFIDWLKETHCTCVITSHDLDMIWETCERVLLLDKGEVIADDIMENILRNTNLLTAHALESPYRFNPDPKGVAL